MTGKIDWLKTVALLVLLFSQYFAADEITKIQLNDLQEYSIQTLDGGQKYYTVNVEEEKNTDLLIKLNCLSVYCYASLSVEIQYAQNPDPYQPPYSNSGLQYNGYDICVIKKEDIKKLKKEEQYILIQVSCYHQCKYSLNTVYQEHQEKILFEAEKGKSISVFFNEEGNKNVLLKIPNSHSANMLIKAKLVNKYVNNYMVFDLYGDIGSNIPKNQSEAKFHGEWIFYEGILVIPLSKKELGEDSSFSIAIKAPKNAIIQFSVENNERELNLAEESTYDIVRQNEIQYYSIGFDNMLEYENRKIFLDEGNKRKFALSFQFSLVPKNGNPDLYIHYGENRPSQIDEFKWSSESRSKQNLIVVTSDELNLIGYTLNSKIFIAVLGNSAYELKIQKKDELQDSNYFLQDNQQVTGYVGKKKIQNYSLRINGSKREIYIALQSYLGNADLFMKIDKGNSRLTITKEEIDTFLKNINDDQSNQNQTIPFIGWSINKQSQDLVKIKYDPDNCYENYVAKYNYYKYCDYQIAIYGNEESNKYVLGAYSKDESYKQIFEHQPEQFYVEANKNQQFFYQPMKLDQYIYQIRFEIQHYQGFAMIAVDREYQNFETKPERDFVRNFFKKQFQLIFLNFNKKQMSSKQNHYVEYNQSEIKQGKLSDYKYYIQVKSTEFAKVGIMVKIVRQGQEIVDYTELLSGFSYKLMINSRSSKYFKFIHYSGEEQTVVARSNYPIKMYIGEYNNPPPIRTQNTYDADSNTSSQSTVKRINISSSQSTNESYLFGTVENISNEEILVIVQSQSDTINIDLNACIEDILIPGVQRTYFFNIYHEISNEEIYLIVYPSGTVLNQNLTGFFKINEKVVGIFKDNDPLKMYKIEQKELRKECMHLFNDIWQDCQVKIEVLSSQEQRLIVSVNVPNRPNYIQYYGSTISQLPLMKEARKFLYYIYGDKELLLSVQSYSYQVQLLIKIITQNQFKNMKVLNGNNFPKYDDDSKNIQLFTKPNLIHQVRIQPETYKGYSCIEGCFLMVSVVLPKAFEIADEEVLGNIIKLNISGDKVIDLVEGENFQGTVEKEEMQYYRVYVPIEHNQEKLFIYLTPLDNGDPDLFLNKDSSKIPTEQEFDFKFQEISGNFLIVDQNTFKNSKNSSNIAGYYIVGVYGRSKSTYQISYNTGKHRIQKIDKDTINQQTLNKDDTQYYVFHKKEKGFFTVVTNTSSGSDGDSYIFIKELTRENDKIKKYMKGLDNPNNADITTLYSNNKNILRYEKNDCDNCTYVIGVKAERKISFSFSVKVDGGVAQIQNNKNHLVYLKKQVIGKLRFYSNDDFNLYVSAYSGHCIEVRVSNGQGEQILQLKPKLCKASEDVKSNGFDSFNLFVQHPNIGSVKQGGQSDYSIFDIELTSSDGDEKVIVQGVTGKEARLITVGVPLEQTISSENKLAQFTYYSSHEGKQSVSVHISPGHGSEDALKFIDFEMVVQDQDANASVKSNTIAHTKDLYAKSFITNMNIPYMLNVKYTGTTEFKFSILLKEINTSNIPILSGTVFDELPLKEFSNYVVHVKAKQYILIQNFNCISDQNIFVYTNSTDMLSQNSNAEKLTRKSASNHEILIIKITQDNQGEIYIQKRATKHSNEIKSISLILSETFQEDERIIYNYIQIANSGLLDVKHGDNKIDISFKDIECTEAECYDIIDLTITKIEYTLHISENSKDLQRMTNCLLRENSDLSVNDVIQPISLADFSALKNQETRKFIVNKDLIPKEINKIYVQVSAKVFITKQNTYRFIYGSQVVNDLHSSGGVIIFEDNSDSYLGLLIAICAVTIIILLIIILQQQRRNRQVYNKLQYEMNDVRNVAFSDIEKDVSLTKENSSIIQEKNQQEYIEIQ